MSAEVVKAWIGVIVTSLPLTWVVFASADTAYGFAIEASVLILGFYVGYTRNKSAVHPASLIVPGYI